MNESASQRPLNLWAFSCAHVGTDLRQGGRESLAEAIRQSESPAGFAWHIAVNLGDHSGTQGEPDDDEGREVVRQYGVLQSHHREQIYDIAGNHDRSDVGHPEGWWTDKWIDPTGTHTAHSGVDAQRRPYAIEGDWERYRFRVGNVLFLMMSDRNEPTAHLPRHEGGGNPSGVVSAETFAWWKQQVEANQDSLIVTCHHYMLKDTTVASGEWEGCWQDEAGQVQRPITATNPTARRAAHPISTGSAESPMLRHSRRTWLSIPAPSICGWARIRTRIPTIRPAINHTLKRGGAHTLSTSLRSRAITSTHMSKRWRVQACP